MKTVEQWQAEIDALFPAAVNVRLTSNIPPQTETDSSAVGIHVWGVTPAGFPRVKWWGDGTNKSFRLDLESFDVVQTKPFVNVQATFQNGDYTLLFWPRPVSDLPENDSIKREQRDDMIAMAVV